MLKFQRFKTKFTVQLTLRCSFDGTCNYKNIAVLDSFNFLCEKFIIRLVIDYITII